MRIAVTALGCKTNQYEMDALAEDFRRRGFTQVDPEEEADLYVLNTCLVTGEAERKSRQILRRFRRQNPSALIVACGCYSQRQDLDGLADLVTGTSLRGRLPEMILEALAGGAHSPIIRTQTSLDGAVYEELGAPALTRETRAFLKIQDGCDNRCAYCAICLARGPARSRSLEAILAEAEELTARGYRELVLTGTNLNAYGTEGADLPDLIDVLEALDQVRGLDRLRLGSLESGTMTETFVGRASRLEHLCPSFHLSLQSGSDRILRAMRRRDNKEAYRQAVARIRSAWDWAGITTDLIVGFPGETQEDFEETLAFCREIGFLRIHVFRFSPRPGTAAASFADRVPEAVAAWRSARLREEAGRLAAAAIQERLGQEREILVEEILEDGSFTGYTPEYIHVIGKAEPEEVRPPARGQIRRVLLCGHEGESARVTLVQTGS